MQYEDTWMLEDWPLFGGQLLTGPDALSADDSEVFDLRQDDLKFTGQRETVGVVEKPGGRSPGGFWKDNGLSNVTESKVGRGRYDVADIFGLAAERTVDMGHPAFVPSVRHWISYDSTSPEVRHTWPVVLLPETFELGDVSVPDVDYGVGPAVRDETPSPPVRDVVEELFSDFLDDVDIPELFTFEDILSNISPEEVDSLLSSPPPSTPPSFGFEVAAIGLEHDDVAFQLPFEETSSLFESGSTPIEITPEDNPLYEDSSYPMSVTSGVGSLDGSSVFDDSESASGRSSRSRSSRGADRREPYSVPGRRLPGDLVPRGDPAPKLERRQRKKDQNKTAALRYRQKKRDEQGTVLSEYETIEKHNIQLKTKVEEITKEIAYLKKLMTELDIQLP